MFLDLHFKYKFYLRIFNNEIETVSLKNILTVGNKFYVRVEVKVR